MQPESLNKDARNRVPYKMENQNKEILYTDFTSLGNVVSDVLKDKKLQQGIKRASLFKFWGKIVGKKFEKYSKPDSITPSNVLVIACANAAVCSELTMFKQTILKKTKTYADALGIEIEDINFSHKIWKSQEKEEINEYKEPENPYKKDLTGFNPDDIALDPDEVEAIKRSVNNNTFATPEQRKKMFDAIILDLKIQKFDKQRKNS